MNSLAFVAANNDIGNLERLSRVVFRATQGTAYAIAVDGVGMLSGVIREGNFVLNWVLDPAAGQNDHFASAQPVKGPHGSVYGTTLGATAEAEEPVRSDNPGGASIWYRWTAPATAPVIFDTEGSLFDAAIFRDVLLTVYAGDSLAGLALVADNYNPATGGYFTTASFPALAGTEYFISVDGYYDPMFCRCTAAGTVALRWTQPDVVLLSLTRCAADGALEATLDAPAGRTCIIESSTNLLTWQAWTQVVTTSTATDARLEGVAQTGSRRFFRAVLNP
jgi:hypothetical protein